MQDRSTAKAREGKRSYIKDVVSNAMARHVQVAYTYLSCHPQSSLVKWPIYGKRESRRQNIHC